MKKATGIFFLLAVSISAAQEKNVLQSYEPMEREAPKPLISGDDIRAAEEARTNLAIEAALKGYSDEQKKAIKAAVKEMKSSKAKIDSIKRLKNSMAITGKGLAPLPRFFHRSNNRLKCRGIQITDAAQSFNKGATYLHLKFRVPFSGDKSTPDNFLNSDMRRAFALYTSKNKEAAFYRPVDLDDNMRYGAGNIYTARWRVAQDGGNILNNIRCADRRFPTYIFSASGHYEALPRD